MAITKNEQGKWFISSNSGKSFTKELATNGKYLDANILIEVESQDGALELDKENGKILVTEGYVDKQDEITLDKATTSASVSIAEKDYLSATPTAYPVIASASGTVSQGWIAEETTTAAEPVTKYIKAGSVSNAAISGTDYTEKTVGALVVDGDDSYLYIEEGYVEATKISLADMVPDEATIGAAESSDAIRVGTTAYNIDGKIVAGTMKDATVAPSAVVTSTNEITVADADLTESDGKFVSKNYSKAIEGTVTADVTQVGFIEDDVTSTAVTGNAIANFTVDKAEVAVKQTAIVGAKPALSNSTISVEGVTDAAAAGASTEAPTSGVFVKVDASAAAGTKGSIKADVNTTSAGYIKAGEVAEDTFETTLQDADALYVPIKAGAVTVTVPQIAVSDGISITGDSENGYTVNVTGSAQTVPVVTEGWVKEVGATDVKVAGTASLEATKLTQTGVVGTDYVITASKGYNNAALTTEIPVFQGEVVGE